MSRRRLLSGVAAVTVAAATGCMPHSARARAGVRRLPERRGDWWLPAGDEPAATVVLIHGGYWQPGYDRHLEDRLAADLADRGYVVWNLDYRPASAGWPATLLDVAAGYDALTSGVGAARVDRDRVAIVGHSAGGQLALWLASRAQLAADAPGHPPRGWLRPRLTVGQAPVAALREAADAGLGGGAAIELCGGTPYQQPRRYAITDPSSLVPATCAVRLIHGRDDDVVPLSQSRHYQHTARAAGGQVDLAVVAGGHFTHLDPRSEACAQLRRDLAVSLHPSLP